VRVNGIDWIDVPKNQTVRRRWVLTTLMCYAGLEALLRLLLLYVVESHVHLTVVCWQVYILVP